jgi:hypothetical protein
MPLNLQNLNVLKQMMMEEKEIGVVYDYFFDHFGESRAFMAMSKPARNPLLEAVLAQTVGGMLGLKGVGRVMKVHLLTVPGHPFYHGSTRVAGHVITFIYFDDAKIGCIAAAAGPNASMTQFVRFSTLTPLTKPSPPSPN